MEFKFECLNCGQHISATFDQIGITGPCPTCNASVTVPNPGGSAPLPTGFFTIESQTKGTRIAWIFSIPLSLAFLSLGVYVARETIRDIRMGAPPGGSGILLLLLLFVIPALGVIAGLRKSFQRPGLYFAGIRTTESGFEAGSFTVDLASVKPRDTWRRSFSGRVSAGQWTPDKTINTAPLVVVIFLKEDRNSARHYFFERFIIASKDTVIHQFTGAKTIAETNSNDIVVMLNGCFELLGGRQSIPSQRLLRPLEQTADVLATAGSGKPPTCTLNFASKTVGADKLLLFGLVGGIIAAGIDSQRKSELQKSFKERRLFDAALTQKLADFAETRGWTITAGDR